jgi:hypothetical protein
VIGQSTAPLPDDPNVPPAKDDTGPKGVTAPISPPASGDVGSPVSPGPAAPMPTTTPDAGAGEQPVPAPADAGVWSPPPDAP